MIAPLNANFFFWKPIFDDLEYMLYCRRGLGRMVLFIKPGAGGVNELNHYGEFGAKSFFGDESFSRIY